jgi:hypothetical protein
MNKKAKGDLLCVLDHHPQRSKPLLNSERRLIKPSAPLLKGAPSRNVKTLQPHLRAEKSVEVCEVALVVAHCSAHRAADFWVGSTNG